MTTHSQRLRETISLVDGHLSNLIHDVWYHPRLSELYPEFLFAIYGVTASSAPAMRAAADRCAATPAGDPLAAWLQDYYREHAEEEAGHEQWLLNDLGSLGVPRQQALQRLPYASVAALVGAQYYWMLHVHPIAYLGYIAVVEAPTSIDFLEEVSRRTGIPLSSMSGHVMHATLDPGHVAEFDRALDSLPLQPHHQDLITVSAITTVAHLENMFADILQHFERIADPVSAATIFTSPQVAPASR
jgi:hypothetical protein